MQYKNEKNNFINQIKEEKTEDEDEAERMKKWMALQKLRKGIYEQRKNLENKKHLKQYNDEILKNAESGNIEECLKVYQKIIKDGVEPNSQTFGIIIGYYSNVGNRGEMEEWFDKMIALTSPNSMSFNALLNYYGKEGLPHELMITASLMVKKGVKLNRSSYLILDRFFSTVENRNKTLFWFKRMIDYGSNLDIVTFNLLIRYMAKANKEKVDFWFKVMNENKVKPSAATFNTVINNFQNAGDSNSAQTYLQKMEEAGFHPDVYTCVSMMRLFSRRDDQMKMMLWFEKVPSEHRSAAYNTILDYYCKKKNSENVEFWLSLMEKEGIKPNTLTYNILMTDAIHNGNKKRLIELGKEMEEKKILPNGDTRKLLQYFMNHKVQIPQLAEEEELD